MKHHSSLTGTVTVKDSALLGRLKADPGAFYANLHTAEFPGGAVRGQLHRVTTPSASGTRSTASRRPSCAAGRSTSARRTLPPARSPSRSGTSGPCSAGGSRTPSPRRTRGRRSGSRPTAAPSPEPSVGKTPNGDGNIPELDLKATQSGERHGLLAGTAEILRLNTVGGVAPSGSCAAGDLAAVPLPGGTTCSCSADRADDRRRLPTGREAPPPCVIP
ncbi:CHRD domain-containing protein [Streptomyces sp. KL116D]|uniref:CHRD domain-containing protein n=1 Tax=Streptomyces sp. KL116D TaxID=3045152 RepID=UPI003557EE87